MCVGILKEMKDAVKMHRAALENKIAQKSIAKAWCRFTADLPVWTGGPPCALRSIGNHGRRREAPGLPGRRRSCAPPRAPRNSTFPPHADAAPALAFVLSKRGNLGPLERCHHGCYDLVLFSFFSVVKECFQPEYPSYVSFKRLMWVAMGTELSNLEN